MLDRGREPEAGSFLNDPLPRREAGSFLNDPPPRGEAGSVLDLRRRFDDFESGSVLVPRGRSGEFEAGSVLARPGGVTVEAGSVLIIQPQPRPQNTADPGPPRLPPNIIITDGDTAGDSRTAAPSRSSGAGTNGFRWRLTPLALVLVGLAGASLILLVLHKLGMGNPWAREVWPRRIDLCAEVAGRLDSFMDAWRREDFDGCQQELDALHATNGRRAVLLSNDANGALYRFLQVAVNCRLSGREPDFRRNLESRFAHAIEALRRACRQPESLSLEVRQSLIDANKAHRTLRERG
ncbi:MAG: hypothetical protein KY476_07080 [Planctomycetes bacterium]|nr:hypothetical protein [Planctomycetota bacterium]